MREINAISAKKHLVVSTEPNLFRTEYKYHEQNRSTGVRGNFFTDSLNVAKLLICGCQECLDCIQNRLNDGN